MSNGFMAALMPVITNTNNSLTYGYKYKSLSLNEIKKQEKDISQLIALWFVILFTITCFTLPIIMTEMR